MLTSKLCSSNHLFVSCFAFMRSPHQFQKTFSILTKATKRLETNNGRLPHLKFFNKEDLKGLFRKQGTVAVDNVTAVRKKVGVWFLCCSTSVFAAIGIGGYTRLTESGLSMVTWRFAFENYPQSEEEWIFQFEKYQQYPEFKQLKKDITLEEFKKIWKIEYFHRIWGRIVGITFLLPATVFWLRGYFLKALKKRIIIFGSLIGAQGLMGWYMVKSGLEDRFHKENDIPRVSQYRLASHLGLALVLYSGFLWTAFELLIPSQPLQLKQNISKLKILMHSCKATVFLTALSGAFVAGLDAGLVYNSFPKMGDKWIPDDILALSPNYKNFTENPTTVQFIHRILGTSTLALSIATWATSKKYPLPRRVRKCMNLLLIVACYQAYLGYATLVSYVERHHASAHQMGSVFLLSTAIAASQQIMSFTMSKI